MRINYNVSAMLTNNNLANNDNLLSQSLQRLSSGLKVNSAKDNPAGLAMAKRMNAQLEGLSAANRNASDGVSVIETADGALTEVSEMLQRLNELAIKAANGVESENDRKVIQEEVDKILEEITRVSEATEFNGQPLLDGEFSLKGYTNHVDVKVSSYSEDVAAKLYTIDSLKITRQQMMVKRDGEPALDKDGNPIVDADGDAVEVDSDGNPVLVTYYSAEIAVPAGDNGNFPQGKLDTSVKNGLLTIQGANGFEMVLDLNAYDLENYDFGDKDNPKELEVVTTKPDGSPSKVTNLVIDATGIGAMRLQIGANEGQIIAVDIPEVSLRKMGIEGLDVTEQDTARESITRLDDAIRYVSSVRGRLGAYQNRLESAINSLDVTSENMTAAYSRIMDTDMAEEMTNYTTYQVMTQAATSMLAQANERPAQVLQLLQ